MKQTNCKHNQHWSTLNFKIITEIQRNEQITGNPSVCLHHVFKRKNGILTVTRFDNSSTFIALSGLKYIILKRILYLRPLLENKAIVNSQKKR